ncbi:MAG: hypothetical protein WKF43_15690 [Acidimicrobiales bacterium]
MLRESLESLDSQASRVELTKDLDLDDVAGVDIEVKGLELSSAELGEGVASVRVKGTLASSANDRELPLGDVARDLLVDSLPSGGYQEVAADVEEAINREAVEGIQLVTLREADGWHVSVWYTIAEYIRLMDERPVPVPNFGHSSVKPVGAESPEAAVRGLLEVSGDYEKMVSMATPEESRVLYDYIPVLVLAAEQRPYFGDTKVYDLEMRTEGDGDRRIVSIEGYDIETTFVSTYTTDENSSEATATNTNRFSFDGNCFTYRSTYSSDEPTEKDPYTDKSCRAEALKKGTTALVWDLATDVQLTVERHDGRWFVSPVRSLADQTAKNLAAVPDTRSFRDLVSSDDSSGIYLLPYNTLGLVYGAFPVPFGPLLYSSSESSGWTSYEEGSTSPEELGPAVPEEPPSATTGPAPEPGVPTTSLPSTTVLVPPAPGAPSAVPAPAPPTTGG